MDGLIGLIMASLLYSSYRNEGDRASQNFSGKLGEDSMHGLSYIAFTNLSSSEKRAKERKGINSFVVISAQPFS